MCVTWGLSKVFADVKEKWVRYHQMNPTKPLDTTTVAAVAVTALCDDPLYANLIIVHPDMDDITFADFKLLVMKYYSAYVTHSQVPKRLLGDAMAVQDLGDACDMARVSLGQPPLQFPFCRGVVSYHKFRECPHYVKTIQA